MQAQICQCVCMCVWMYVARHAQMSVCMDACMRKMETQFNDCIHLCMSTSRDICCIYLDVYV